MTLDSMKLIRFATRQPSPTIIKCPFPEVSVKVFRVEGREERETILSCSKLKERE